MRVSDQVYGKARATHERPPRLGKTPRNVSFPAASWKASTVTVPRYATETLTPERFRLKPMADRKTRA